MSPLYSFPTGIWIHFHTVPRVNYSIVLVGSDFSILWICFGGFALPFSSNPHLIWIRNYNFQVLRSWPGCKLISFCFKSSFFSCNFVYLLFYCAGVWFQRAWCCRWLARGEGRCGRRGRHRIRYPFRILRPGSGTISPWGGKIFWIHKVLQCGTSPSS